MSSQLPTLKKTATRVKFDGNMFLHNSRCVEGNHEPKIYLILNGVRYHMVKGNAAEQIPDQFEYEDTIELPTKREIQNLEQKVRVSVEEGDEDGIKPDMIKWNSKYPGRKTKALYLNPKTGNYVSYIRAIQLKLV